MFTRLYLESFGCQMNQLDSELIVEGLEEAGYRRVDSPEEADVILFNTCSVRQHAEDRVVSRAGRMKPLKRRRPEIVVGILGCLAQREGEALLKRLPHVTLLCGPHQFGRLPELIEGASGDGHPVVALAESDPVLPKRSFTSRRARTRAFVSIMRGCNNRCAYCIVPLVRGREVSRRPDDVIAEVRSLAEDGCREVTLLGQNVTRYGRGLEGTTLATLLASLNDIDGLARIRFVTSHPRDTGEDIFRAMGELEKVCEYLHLPAQAGSDRILRAMGRGYTAQEYVDQIGRARQLIPHLEVAGDFIVGFPGETEDDFEATLRLMEQVEFLNCYLFKYSPRPMTAAAEQEDDVPAEVKSRRHARLLQAQEAISRRRHQAWIGRTVEVLVEGTSPKDATRLCGRTRYNHIVVWEGALDTVGCLVPLRIERATARALYGADVDQAGE